MRSHTDYILGSDCRIFQNVAARDPRQNSEHYMVLGYLRGAPPEGILKLTWAQDVPPSSSTRTSDEVAGKKYLC